MHLLVLALIYVASQLELGVASRIFGACLLASAAVLAWALLGQSIAPMQLLGALVVVSTVMWLGLRKR